MPSYSTTDCSRTLASYCVKAACSFLLACVLFPAAPLEARNLFASMAAKPSLVLLYRSDCAPCNLEIGEVLDFRKILPDWNIAVASLTPLRKDFSDRLHKEDIQIIDFSSLNAKDVLHSVHDASSALPFSLALRSTNALCGWHTGLLGSDILAKWKNKCSS